MREETLIRPLNSNPTTTLAPSLIYCTGIRNPTNYLKAKEIAFSDLR
jgi:hypothetical protein